MNLTNGNFINELRLITFLLFAGYIVFAVTMLLLVRTISSYIDMATDKILKELKDKNKE